SDVAVQGDGKIRVAGSVDRVSRDALVARYNTNGTLDGSFGVGRILRFDLGADETLTDIRVVSGGNILLGGPVADGATAPLFHLASFAAHNIAIQSDGRIVVTGDEPATVKAFTLRLLANGGADNSFSGDGIVLTAANGHALDPVVQSTGRIVVLFSHDFYDG